MDNVWYLEYFYIAKRIILINQKIILKNKAKTSLCFYKKAYSLYKKN